MTSIYQHFRYIGYGLLVAAILAPMLPRTFRLASGQKLVFI